SALWELFLETAQGELSQARQLAAGAEGSLDPEYTRSMSEFEQQVADDKSDYELAQRLENIRLDIAITKEGQFQVRKASDGYAKIFAAFEVPSDDPVKAVARIAHSPIKHQLVASLDNWARIASHLN